MYRGPGEEGGKEEGMQRGRRCKGMSMEDQEWKRRDWRRSRGKHEEDDWALSMQNQMRKWRGEELRRRSRRSKRIFFSAGTVHAGA